MQMGTKKIHNHYVMTYLGCNIKEGGVALRKKLFGFFEILEHLFLSKYFQNIFVEFLIR